MEYSFKTQGVCAQIIKFKLDGDVVSDIEFMGGCNGNLKAISKLLDGTKVDYIEDKLLGNSCGGLAAGCLFEYVSMKTTSK